MSDDIVKKRLLRTDGYDLLREEPIYVNPDGPKAADEIERLRAELAAERERADKAEAQFDRLAERHREAMVTCGAEMDDAKKLRAERDALRALLREARTWVPVKADSLLKSIDRALNKGGTDDAGQ